MTPVSLSLHRLAAFFSRAVSTLLTSARVCSEALRQLSCLSLWVCSSRYLPSLINCCLYFKLVVTQRNLDNFPKLYPKSIALRAYFRKPVLRRCLAGTCRIKQLLDALYHGLLYIRILAAVLITLISKCRPWLQLLNSQPQMSDAVTLVPMTPIQDVLFYHQAAADHTARFGHAGTPTGAMSRLYVSRFPTMASINESNRSRVWRFTSPSFSLHANSSTYRNRCLAEA